MSGWETKRICFALGLQLCLFESQWRSWLRNEGEKETKPAKANWERKKKTKEDFGNIDDLGNVSGVGCFELFALNLKAISHGISMTLELF